MLLQDVRQFVREQPPPIARLRRVASWPENDVPSYCLSQRIDRSGRLDGLRIHVDADLTEVMAKPRFHETTHV